jgi:hypothetical protein
MSTIIVTAIARSVLATIFHIRTVFLNRYLEEEMYSRPPAGFKHLAGGPGCVVRLRRTLYGLRQAPRAWNKQLESKPAGKGFLLSNAVASLWILHGEDGSVR